MTVLVVVLRLVLVLISIVLPLLYLRMMGASASVYVVTMCPFAVSDLAKDNALIFDVYRVSLIVLFLVITRMIGRLGTVLPMVLMS